MLKRLWCLLWHRAAWHRHDVLRALAICARCGEIYEVANGYLAADHVTPYPTGTDAQALNVQPPGALTARDLPNQIGLPGRKAMEGRTRG